MQSHLDEIHLLPALPTVWKTGKITGLRARNGFETDIQWENNVLKEATIYSHNGVPCTLCTSVPIRVNGINAVTEKQDTPYGIYYITRFETKNNKQYRITLQ